MDIAAKMHLKMPTTTDYYDGSRAFTWLSDLCGLPIDQLNFLMVQSFALCMAPLFRNVLHPTRVSAKLRHLLVTILGSFCGYFCFGKQAFHLAGLPTVCYFVMRCQEPKVMQRMVLVVSLLYLSGVHLHRQVYDYGSYTLDITGPLMVVVQKVTSLAFSLHDGLACAEEDLTEARKYHAVRRMPSLLEYYGYMLHFQALMAGPVVFYRDYMQFIHGTGKGMGSTDGAAKTKQVVIEPSPTTAVAQKVVISLVYALLLLKFLPLFPIQVVKEPEFLLLPFSTKITYLMVATAVHRFKYYHAWLLADAICNASGLGWNGYNEDGTSNWDRHSNIDVIGFEFGLNLRESIEHWNKGTNQWLRLIVYDRVKKNATMWTYALSAFWHGFYPGYYLTFASGALFTFAARSVRRTIRPYFLESPTMKATYDVATMITTRVVMAYMTFSFILLEFWPSVRCYLSMYLSLHVLAVLVIAALPRIVPIPRNQGAATMKNKLAKLATTNGLATGING